MYLKGIVIFSFILCIFTASAKGLPSGNSRTETSDIDLFWKMYDSLAHAASTDDSIAVIQQVYLDNMSRNGKDFIKIRKYTAHEYLRTIRKYPRFFSALRIRTSNITVEIRAIDSTLNILKDAIPGFKVPDVSFAIGCFRGGGTIKKNTILLGAEIALSDPSMDCSEFQGWIQTVLKTGLGSVAALIAHESIHCQQSGKRGNTLIAAAMQEGIADFLPALFLHTNINEVTYAYGIANECTLWKEFETQMYGSDITAWLFNGSGSKNRPADLGYFIGNRICEAYYNRQTDKKKAIRNLLNRTKYEDIFKQSGYNGHCTE